MNKLEKFSLNSSLKAGDIFINECFYPIVQEKYITFDCTSNIQSISYDHWQEVIDFIKPHLDKKNIDIIRVGNESGNPIDGVIDHRNKTFNQESYIISKSSLHFGTSELHSLVAGKYGTPQVRLFSPFKPSTYPLKNSEKNLFIDSDRQGTIPISSPQDPRKLINNISPAEVAFSILNKLKIKNDLNNLHHLYAGKLSHVKTIEIVPDFTPDKSFLNKALVNIRADLNFDEQSIYGFSLDRKLGIITNKPFSKELLSAIRSSVSRISVNADDGLDQEFLDNLKALNIKYEIFSSKRDGLSSLRLDYIDESIEYYPKTTKKEIDFDIDSSYDMLMRSSKILISKNGKFASKAHWIVGKELNSGLENIIDTSDFWEDLDFMHIYKQEK